MTTTETIIYFGIMGLALLYGAILITVWILASIHCYKAQHNTQEAWQRCIESAENLRQAEAAAEVKWETGRERRLAILRGED